MRKKIQEPVAPSKVGIQEMKEEFDNAKNNDMITKDEYERFNEFNEFCKGFIKALEGDRKNKKLISDARVVERFSSQCIPL